MTLDNKNIAQAGDPILRIKCSEVSIGENISYIIKSLKENIEISGGVGLAANQLKFDKRIFAIQLYNKITVYINPKIIFSSRKRITFEEGCLSIPEIYAPVSRPINIKVNYLNENMCEQTEDLWHLKSTIFQHELDHLNGILFTDYIDEKLYKNLVSKINNGILI